MSDMSTRHEPERAQKEILEQLFQQTELSTFDLFRNFPVFTPRFNLARFLTHYELFKKVYHLPGSIVDIGVFRGASTFTWAKLCEIFCPTDARKLIYGFDTFSGFPDLAPEDGRVNEREGMFKGGYNGGRSVENDLKLAAQALQTDKFLKHVERIQFIKGDISETLPRFVQEHDGLRISLLNLDADLYLPTKLALELFVPKMVQGGIIICDEYAVETFAGESQAVDEYFQKTFGKKPKLQKFDWHSNPSAWIQVDW